MLDSCCHDDSQFQLNCNAAKYDWHIPSICEALLLLPVYAIRGQVNTIVIHLLFRKIHELAKNDNFVRQALTITFLSILMEIFGQIFISGFTALGYLYYFQQ